MALSIERQIHEQLTRYLRGEIPLSAFQEWFIPATWNVEEAVDPEAEALASEIMLRLAEFGNRHWTEDELRYELRRILDARSNLEAWANWPITIRMEPVKVHFVPFGTLRISALVLPDVPPREEARTGVELIRGTTAVTQIVSLSQPGLVVATE